MERLQYLDFDLDIGPGNGHQYPVSVRSSAGEARATMRFPFDELALKNRLQALEIVLLRSIGKRRALSPAERTVQEFGQSLFEALLTDEVRDRYTVNLERARSEGKELRLKLHIQPPELASLPWEFLYDPRRRDFVCLSNTSIVRYPDAPFPIQPLTVSAPLRILGLVVSPEGLAPLDVENEKQRIEEAIQGLRAEGLVDLTWLAGQTWRDLQRAMRRGPWHIFHFVGHGGFDRNTGEGLIALTDDENKPYYLSAISLGRLLDGHRFLKLVLLNSCDGARGSDSDIFSSTAANLVNKGIPAVLAMQYEITDRAAIEFARSFYEALADGLPVDAAVAQARESISLAIPNTIEWGTPVLYMRSPDGVLFNLTKKPVAHEALQPELGRIAEPPEPETERPAQTPPLKDVAPTAQENISPLPVRENQETTQQTGQQKDEPETQPTQQGAEQEQIARREAEPLSQLTVRLERMLTGHTKEVLGVAFSPNGKTLASASGGAIFPGHQPLRLWRVADGELLRSFEGHAKGVISVAFSPTGETLASGSHDNTMRLWRVADGELLNTLKEHTDSITSVAFSPDGTMIASGSRDKTIRLWRVADGEPLHTLDRHKGRVTGVAFSPDGALIASSAHDKMIKLWRVSDGRLLHTLEGHTRWVTGVAFSPDGALIASGGWDDTVRLWRVADGEAVHTLKGDTEPVFCVAFSSAGTLIASGTFEKMIKLWRIG